MPTKLLSLLDEDRKKVKNFRQVAVFGRINPKIFKNVNRKANYLLFVAYNFVRLIDWWKILLIDYRFGRDYYIREASRPQGARKSNGYSNDSNVSTENDLRHLEESYVYSSLPRRLYSQNSSRNFVKNPLLNFHISQEDL